MEKLRGFNLVYLARPDVPDRPGPKYQRLSRYDQTGLVRLLQGRPVIALTQAAATILAPSSASLMYHRRKKSAPGLIGDTTDGGGVGP